MNKLFSRVCNWTFGSMFRAFGRIIAIILLILLFNFLSSKGIIRIPHLLSFMKVNAQVIADYENNPTWLYYGANAELINPNESNVCVEGKTKSQISQLMPLNNNSPNNGSIFKSGLNGGIKSNEFYTENTDYVKGFYNLQFGIRPPSGTYWLTNGNNDYYINILVSTARKGEILDNWQAYPLNDGELLEGINYDNSRYWGFFSRNQTTDSFSTKTNGSSSNMIWLTYKLTYPISAPIAQSWGLGFNIFIPTTKYIYCKSGNNGNQSTPGSSGAGHGGVGRHDNDIGEENWFYVIDYIVEKDTHDDTLLTFNYEGVDEEGYWSNEDYPSIYENGGDIDDDINNFPGLLPPGPLDSVLTLPLGIMNSLNQRIQSSCSPLTINIPFLRNKTLTIPCISSIFSSIPGLNNFLDFLGAIASGIIMYNYLIYLYEWVDDITSLKHTRQRLFGAKSDADNWGGVE